MQSPGDLPQKNPDYFANLTPHGPDAGLLRVEHHAQVVLWSGPMFRLFGLLLGLPWPVMALIAVGFFWLAENSREWVMEFEAEKAQALESGVPAPVPLDQFTKDSVGLADEVHVTAWVNPEHNYELTKQRKGTDTVRRMFVLFGPGDGLDSTVARGVVVLPPDEVQPFIELVSTNVADPMDPRLLFNLNGARDSSPDLSSMVDDALEERGLLKGTDFLVVEPYLEGRAAALAPNPDAPMRNFTMIGGIGAVAALLALVKFMAGRRARARRKAVERSAMGVSPSVAAAFADAAVRTAVPVTETGKGAHPAPLTPTASGDWSPLEAVRAKQAARQEAGAGSVRSGGFGPLSWPAAGVSSGRGLERSLPQRDGVGLRRLYRVPATIVGALALYVAMYLGFGQFTLHGSMNTVPQGGMMAEVMEGMIGFDPAEVEAEFEKGVAAFTDEAAQVVPVAPMQVGGAAGGDVATDAGPTVPTPQGISGVERPLPQIGDKPPSPKDQVQEDIATGVPPAEAIRKAITAEFPDETEPAGPVFLSTAKDEPAAEAGVMEQLRDLIPQGWAGMTPAQVSASVTGGGLWKGPAGIAVLFALGSALAAFGMALARRSRRRAVATHSDPWARISDRLQ